MNDEFRLVGESGIRLDHWVCDERRTWPLSKRLRTGDSQNSCLTQLPDGDLGCLDDCWSEGNYQRCFLRFNVAARNANP